MSTRRIKKKQVRDSHGLRNKIDARGRCNINKRGPKVLTAEEIAAAEEVLSIRRAAVGDVMKPDAHEGFDAERYARWVGAESFLTEHGLTFDEAFDEIGDSVFDAYELAKWIGY